MAEASRLDRLVLLRSTLERSLASEDVPVRDFASLSREYRATLAEIAELEPKKPEGDVVDEIAQRRRDRRPGTAKGAPRTKRSG